MINSASSPSQDIVPILENGDRLSRKEFERRYQAMSPSTQAELIAGTVYMPSPVRARSYGQPHSQIMLWLGTYTIYTPGVSCFDHTSVRLDWDNEPQPDGILRIETESRGQSRISADDYIEGAPELIIEIASSSVAYDLHDKQEAYRRNGVQEYLVWQIRENQIRWWKLAGGMYQPLSANEEGVIAFEVFPGLQLNPTALLDGDMATVLATLQEGMKQPSYQSFLEQLQNNEHLD